MDYGPLVLPGGYAGGVIKMNAYRLSAGLVYRIGDLTPPLATALSCLATPAVVFTGDSVSITSTATGLNLKRAAQYTWTANGGNLAGNGPTAQVSTAGLAAGSYVVLGKVSQGSKPYQNASCSAAFQVKAIEPPTLTCSANPASIHTGESSTITSVGVSPQNRPLTYTFATTAGRISGQDNLATLNAAGAAPGAVTITCTVVDDRGQTAQATTAVQVIAPEIPPIPQPRELCSLSFDRDLGRPARVDNEAKGCLDDVALTLEREADSRLVQTGNAGPGEPADVAAERAIHARLYLTHEKGIDSTRITLRTGSSSARSVTNTLVPTGATADPTGTRPVVEGSVIPHGEAYGTPRPKPTPRRRKHTRRKRRHT